MRPVKILIRLHDECTCLIVRFLILRLKDFVDLHDTASDGWLKPIQPTLPHLLEISRHLNSAPYLSYNSSKNTAVLVSVTTELAANNVDPGQTPRHAASDLGQHCLLRTVCLNTQSNYGTLLSNSNSSSLFP